MTRAYSLIAEEARPGGPVVLTSYGDIQSAADGGREFEERLTNDTGSVVLPTADGAKPRKRSVALTAAHRGDVAGGKVLSSTAHRGSRTSGDVSCSTTDRGDATASDVAEQQSRCRW